VEDERRAGMDGKLVEKELARPEALITQKETRADRAKRWIAAKDKFFSPAT
jgi:hypothetical protein